MKGKETAGGKSVKEKDIGMAVGGDTINKQCLEPGIGGPGRARPTERRRTRVELHSRYGWEKGPPSIDFYRGATKEKAKRGEMY